MCCMILWFMLQYSDEPTCFVALSKFHETCPSFALWTLNFEGWVAKRSSREGFYPISTKLEFSKLPFLYEQLPLSYEQLPLSSNQTTTFILIDFIPVLVLRWMFQTRFARNESYSIIMWWFRTKLPVPKPFQQIVAKLGYNIPQDILNLVSWIHIINKNLAPLPHPI